LLAGPLLAALRASQTAGSPGSPEAGRKGEGEGAELRLVARRRATGAAGAGLVVEALHLVGKWPAWPPPMRSFARDRTAGCRWMPVPIPRPSNGHLIGHCRVRHDWPRPWPSRASRQGGHTHHPSWAERWRAGSPAKISRQRPHRRSLGGSAPVSTTSDMRLLSSPSASVRSPCPPGLVSADGDEHESDGSQASEHGAPSRNRVRRSSSMARPGV